MAERPAEDEEWVTHRVSAWVDTYKKSMLTPVILRLVEAHEPATVEQIATGISSSTPWQITERGLYRTLKRLEDSDLLNSREVHAPRTGAKRKEFTTTTLGRALADGIDDNIVSLPPSVP
jgi:DNA-binding PadR family transcriptional regulator